MAPPGMSHSGSHGHLSARDYVNRRLGKQQFRYCSNDTTTSNQNNYQHYQPHLATNPPVPDLSVGQHSQLAVGLRRAYHDERASGQPADIGPGSASQPRPSNCCCCCCCAGRRGSLFSPASRKQHTLRSIADQRSRSRSPIVAPGGQLGSPERNPLNLGHLWSSCAPGASPGGSCCSLGAHRGDPEAVMMPPTTQPNPGLDGPEPQGQQQYFTPQASPTAATATSAAAAAAAAAAANSTIFRDLHHRDLATTMSSSSAPPYEFAQPPPGQRQRPAQLSRNASLRSVLQAGEDALSLSEILANLEASEAQPQPQPNLGHIVAQGSRRLAAGMSLAVSQQQLPAAAAAAGPNSCTELHEFGKRHEFSRSAGNINSVGHVVQADTIGSSRLAHHSSSSSSSSSSSAASSLGAASTTAGSRHRSRRPGSRRSGASSNLAGAAAAERRAHEMATGFEIVWLEFTYSIEPNVFEDPRWGKVNRLFHKERRMILKGLSGGLKSGQMVALMGPSGAGKTCLLESISGVRTTGIGGRMCLRGRKKAQLVIVPQYDDFMPQFSVEETIIYGSRMKNPFSTDHRRVAQSVIEQLGLQVCRTNNIRACSGGQRKRVAIAQELVSRPNILILDEPTSGLDSSCCYHTMKVLRDVLDQSIRTDEPMAIVSTIHQPSAKVFKMFDLVYLLGKTGYMAYSGPPDELVATIRDVTGLECPRYSNPSDFMIELVAYDYGEEPVEKLIEFERQKAAQFVRDFDKRAGIRPRPAALGAGGGARGRRPSSHHQQQQVAATQAAVACTNEANVTSRRMSKQSADGGGGGSVSSLRLTPSKSDTHLASQDRGEQLQQRLKANDLLVGRQHVKYRSNVTLPLRKATSNDGRRHPFLWHTWVHLHRSFLQSIRDPILNNMRILIHLGFATLLVLLYGKKSGEARGCPPVLGLPAEITDPHNESMIDLADNVGYLFMCIMMITYVSLMSTVLTFPIDIKTVGKEYKNGWYGTVTYFLGKTVADLPFIVLYPVAYCLITWYMTNQAQDHWWRYFSFTGLIIMNAMNSQSFGLILGALFVNSVTAATFLGPVITIPWYLFTGFTKRVHRLAEPFKTTSKFLFTRYVFEGILDTVYGHQRCNCSEFLQQYYELRFEEANRLGQLISVETLSSLDYYDGLETVAPAPPPADLYNESSAALNAPVAAGGKAGASWFERTFDAASTVFADGDNLNLASLMDTNVRASSLFSFGLDFEPTCPSNYENFVVQDFRLGEKNAQKAFTIVLCMLVAIRVLTFALVAWKIRTRQL